MTYVVFALIVAAALFYLIFSDNRRANARLPEPRNDALSRLLEKRQVIKLSLKDLEYEKTVGKLEASNFIRLQNDLLGEWDILEKEIALIEKEQPVAELPTAAACATCGTALIAAAKFCHACGARLGFSLVAVSLLFLTAAPGLEALDIRVQIQNGTRGGIEASALSVQLLKLEQGMQPVAAKTSTGGKVEFLNLPEMTAGPYMVQTIYRGVTYSRVIPPNMPSPAEVGLEIFESTTATKHLRVRTLVELRRVDKTTLAGLVIFFFVNTDKLTFTGGPEGLSFYLPESAKIEQASVSVGSGSSNIQWLKLNPKPGAQKGFYGAGQNVKPGDRILQVMFRMPYDEKDTLLKFQSLYPQDTGIQVIAEPENLEVRQGEKVLSRTRDESLGRGLISFTAAETQIALNLSGGGIAEVKKTEEAEIEIKSPLSLTQKLLFPLVAMLVFATGLWLRSRRRSV